MNFIRVENAIMRCDTATCDHSQPVNFREVRQYVGALCPKCGAVIVTEETARSVEQQLAAIDAMNSLLGEPPPEAKEVGRLSVRTGLDGEVIEAGWKRDPASPSS